MSYTIRIKTREQSRGDSSNCTAEGEGDRIQTSKVLVAWGDIVQRKSYGSYSWLEIGPQSSKSCFDLLNAIETPEPPT